MIGEGARGKESDITNSTHASWDKLLTLLVHKRQLDWLGDWLAPAKKKMYSR